MRKGLRKHHRPEKQNRDEFASNRPALLELTLTIERLRLPAFCRQMSRFGANRRQTNRQIGRVRDDETTSQGMHGSEDCRAARSPGDDGHEDAPEGLTDLREGAEIHTADREEPAEPHQEQRFESDHGPATQEPQ
jgi:hypothetical protein